MALPQGYITPARARFCAEGGLPPPIYSGANGDVHRKTTAVLSAKIFYQKHLDCARRHGVYLVPKPAY
jgi:hypothetical protein